jgi:hypothetical protein
MSTKNCCQKDMILENIEHATEGEIVDFKASRLRKTLRDFNSRDFRFSTDFKKLHGT